MTWFSLDVSSPRSAVVSDDVQFSNGDCTVQGLLNEDRTLLGSTNLSRGVHYWEWRIDKWETGAQPAFGVAKGDTCRQSVLGKR